MFVHIDSGRFVEHHKNIRTLNWAEIEDMRIVGHGSGQGPIKLPETEPVFYQKLINHSRVIGKRFALARIDFFVFDAQYKFAEVTASHNSCTNRLKPEILEHFFGYMLTHPEITDSVDSDYVRQLAKKYSKRHKV